MYYSGMQGMGRFTLALAYRTLYLKTFSNLNFKFPAFIDMPELVNHARNNHQRWKELDEAGVTTVADVKRAQRQSSLQPLPSSTSQPTAEE